MSILFEPENVGGVLLDDGWHDVDAGTFAIDAWEIVERWLNADNEKLNLQHSEKGFTFLELDVRIAGPMSSIRAVREVPDPVDSWDPFAKRYDGSYERQLAEKRRSEQDPE